MCNVMGHFICCCCCCCCAFGCSHQGVTIIWTTHKLAQVLYRLPSLIQPLHFIQEQALHPAVGVWALAGNQTQPLRMADETPTTEPPIMKGIALSYKMAEWHQHEMCWLVLAWKFPVIGDTFPSNATTIDKRSRLVRCGSFAISTITLYLIKQNFHTVPKLS